jgi:uncharacterized protein
MSGLHLALFVLLAFAWTWSFWLPSAIAEGDAPVAPFAAGLYGPAIAALVIVGFTQRWAGVRQLLGGLLRWRVGGFWYLVVVGLPVILAAAAWAGDWLIAGRMATFDDAAITGQLPDAIAQLPLLAAAAVVLVSTIPGAPLGEELGWRGYALPRLQAWLTPLTAGVALGVVWGAWHLPLFWMTFMPHAEISMAAFMANIIVGSILFVWIYNGTGGSILLVVLFHAVSNTVSALAPVNFHASTVALAVTLAFVAWLVGTGRLQPRFN